MEDRIIEVVAKVAGIGGIALGTLLLLFREFIRKNIFPNLTRGQAYNLLRLFLFLTWTAAIFGIAAWIFAEIDGNKPATSAKPGKRPTLVFKYDNKTGWDLENVGESAAVDVLVAQQDHHEQDWKNPTRLHPLAAGGRVNLFWVGYNADKLGAIYHDDQGNEYHSFCDEDLTELKTERFLPNWEEPKIKKIWEYERQPQ